jgi:hypothetical protein
MASGFVALLVLNDHERRSLIAQFVPHPKGKRATAASNKNEERDECS